ncbi:hypothetical protein C8R45DRAFT_899835 [Mycena sanguinolenta]|nr:hypothetical protein C8R45DRAFT_899835 [Mycena sanguinolenta]
MSTAKPIPAGVNFNKNKRKRTSTGDDVSTTASKASGRATPALAATIVTQRTDPFERVIQSLVDRGIPVPPPTALQHMRQTCSEAVSNYKNAHVTLQKAVTTHQKFAMASSNGTPVSSVLNHLKLPPHQTLTGVPDVMGDERVAAAMAASEKDIATARATATTLLTTVYAVQVEKAQELVEVPRCADALASTLNEYCVRIITRAGDPDTTVWQPCVSAIKAAFTDELKAVRFEFTARLDKEAMAKEAKAHAIETARADAEMADANRPIDEIVSEKVSVAVTALKESLEIEKKKQHPAPVEPNSKPKPRPKAAVTATASSSRDTPKPLKQTKLTMEKKSEKPTTEKKKGKGGKGAVGTEVEGKTHKGKPKGKGKVKAKPADTETAEESSDEST